MSNKTPLLHFSMQPKAREYEIRAFYNACSFVRLLQPKVVKTSGLFNFYNLGL